MGFFRKRESVLWRWTKRIIFIGLQEAIDFTKEKITTEDFRQQYCNDCYWSKWNKCDIEKATLDYCCNASIEIGRYKLA